MQPDGTPSEPRRARGYNRIFFAIAAGIAAAYFAVVVAIDPFRIFGLTHFNRYFQPNTRYLEFRYLEKHPEFNAFVLGSSRANFLSAAELQRASGYRYYNLAAPSDNIYGINRKIAWLVKHRHVSQIVIALDYDMYNAELDPWNLTVLDAPAVSAEPAFEFYAKNLLVPPDLLMRCVTENLKHNTGYSFDVTTGHFTLADTGRGPAKVQVPPGWNAGKRFGTLTLIPHEAALRELAATLHLLDATHVDRIVLINPYGDVLFRSFDAADYASWRARVVAISGKVWDFAGPSGITRNPYNYLDFSHYSGDVGDTMIRTIFARRERPPAAKTFGKLVTAGT